MERTSGLTRSSHRFPSKPPFPLLGNLSHLTGSKSNDKSGKETNRSTDPLRCVHVDDCVVELNGNFQRSMQPIAKCGVCNASPYEKSLWVCLRPECFFIGCADADRANDHSDIHRLQNPNHLIRLNLQSGNVFCGKCSTSVDISSKLKTPGEFRVNLEMLASIKIGPKEERLFEKIIEACVGSDEGRRSNTLKFLTENDDLHHIFPRLLKFVVGGMNLQNDNLATVFVVMRMLRSLLNNQSLSSVFPKYVHEVIPSLGRCIGSYRLPLECDIGDHWALRGFASRIMAALCHGDEFLATNVAKKFSEIFTAQNPALVSFYGVVRGLHELGPDFVRELIVPHIQYISRKIDESGELERKVAERTRNALIRAVAPVLKTLRNPPDLANFGTLGAHFQQSERSKRLVDSAPTSKRFKPSHGASEGLVSGTAPPMSQVASASIGGFPDGRGFAQAQGCGSGMPGIWRLTKAPMPTASDAAENPHNKSGQVAIQSSSINKNTNVDMLASANNINIQSANTLSRSYLEQQQTAVKNNYDNAATAVGLKGDGSSVSVAGGSNKVYADTSMSGRQSDSPEMTKPNGDAGTGLTRSLNQQVAHQMVGVYCC